MSDDEALMSFLDTSDEKQDSKMSKTQPERTSPLPVDPLSGKIKFWKDFCGEDWARKGILHSY